MAESASWRRKKIKIGRMKANTKITENQCNDGNDRVGRANRLRAELYFLAPKRRKQSKLRPC
jgi:hypothetical protein